MSDAPEDHVCKTCGIIGAYWSERFLWYLCSICLERMIIQMAVLSDAQQDYNREKTR